MCKPCARANACMQRLAAALANHADHADQVISPWILDATAARCCCMGAGRLWHFCCACILSPFAALERKIPCALILLAVVPVAKPCLHNGMLTSAINLDGKQQLTQVRCSFGRFIKCKISLPPASGQAMVLLAYGPMLLHRQLCTQ